jgi:hypothetical protein
MKPPRLTPSPADGFALAACRFFARQFRVLPPNLNLNPNPNPNCPPPAPRAFTLVEVMVATAIFFMAMFAILGVLSSGIHAAGLLRSSGPTAGMIAARYYVTNSIDEGADNGDFSDVAGYEKYRWVSTATEVTTNGLYQMEIAVIDPNGNPSSHLCLLLYKPQSGANRLGLQPQR